MKNIWIAVIAVVIGLIVIGKLYNGNRSHVVDWEESFDEKSTKPYGVSVFYKELPRLFEGKKIRTVYYTPSTYLYANSDIGDGEHIAEGIFMIIGNSDYVDDYDVEYLMEFVDRGNTLFISDYYPPQQLLDTLGFDVKYISNGKDSLSNYSFEDRNLKNNALQMDRNEGDFYFDLKGNTDYTILGYTELETPEPNFIKLEHGSGTMYFHLEPKVFTNYHLLKEDRYKYVEGILNHLPPEDVYFDSYSKNYDSYYGDAEQESNLSWFLEQESFRWSWYLALLLALIFALFNAKRRQRIIKIIAPLQNTTVGFVKTISNLYFETQDHKNLVEKKITYFLEKIRTDYNMDTSLLDEDFIERLVARSGKKPDVVTKVIQNINWLRSKNEFFEDNLIQLNRHIEAFYSK